MKKAKSKTNPKWRKPVEAITDRAKRYRANHPDVRPRGRKKCFACSSTTVGIRHKNGDESDNRPANLGWACKRHNALETVKHKRLGKGVRTRQFNPGAKTLGEYVDAAVSHVRGAHDAGGKIIHETPKGKRKSFARDIWNARKAKGNPKPKSSKRNGTATELYTKFQGRGPNKTKDVLVPVTDPYAAHPELAQLGKLICLYVGEGIKMGGHEGKVPTPIDSEYWGPFVISFEEKTAPDLAAEPNARQMYIVGGNQNIDSKLQELGADPEKDLIDLGFCLRVEYFTRKKFDKFMPVEYWHLLGEETGVQPRLMYDRRHKILQFVGGEYVVRPEGIVN